MALSGPVEIGQNAGTTGETTLVVTLAAGAAVGDVVLVRSASGSGGTQNLSFQLSSVADSRGNTYSVLAAEVRVNRYFGAIAGCKVTTALQAGDTITLTYGASVNERVGVVEKVPGGDLPHDGQAVANANSTSHPVGPTAALASQPQLAYCAWGIPDEPIAIDEVYDTGNGWTALSKVGSGGTAGTNSRTSVATYKIVTTTDAVTAPLSTTASEQSAGTLITIPEAASGAVGQTVNPGHVASTAQVFAPSKLNTQVLPAALVSTAQVHAPSVTLLDQTVEVGHLASGAQIHAPTIRTTVTVQPAHLSDPETVHAPTVVPGNVNVPVGHLASTAQVHAPTVQGGEQIPEPPVRWLPTVPVIPEEGRT